jgi:hypothetical protein
MGIDDLDASGQPPQDTEKLEQKIRSGANWFYWIAGLSVLNSAIQLFGSDRTFIIGLGITQAFDGLASGVVKDSDGSVAAVVRAIAFVLDLLVAGAFVLLAWLAGKRRAWAFVLGMVLYALDGLIFILVQEWFSLAFHGFALFGVWAGYSSLKELRSAQIRLGERPIEP